MRRFLIGLLATLTLVVGGSVPAEGAIPWDAVNSLKGNAPIMSADGKRIITPGVTGKTVQAKACCSTQALTYLYRGGQQTGLTNTAGSQARFEIPNPKPTVTTNDFHSLAEIATKKDGSNSQVVEIGWTVDSALNGHTNPDLFVGYWVGGVFQGYNTSSPGYVDYAGTGPNVGDTLTPGDVWEFRTVYQSTGTAGWWFWAGKLISGVPTGDWVGYIPASQWTGANAFTANTVVQYFWEVAANCSTPNTKMGNGTLGQFTPTATGNYIASTTNIGSSPPLSVNTSISTPAYASYNVVLSSPSTRTIRGGGPGDGSAC